MAFVVVWFGVLIVDISQEVFVEQPDPLKKCRFS